MAGQWSGGMLVTVAAIISLQIAQGRSADELDLLAALFTVLGDNLALIAGQLPVSTASDGANTSAAANTVTQNAEPSCMPDEQISMSI